MADGTISKIQLPDNTIYDVVDNTSGYMTGMTILSYGSSTWQNFIDAYSSNKVVYCRASSNSNPASGSQTRLAFMAYVNNASTPTEVEFQYYRSVSTHTASQQGDQVYVYKLNKTNGWSVTTREASVKVVAGTGLGGTYSNGTMTLTGPTKVSDLTNDSGFITGYTETDPVFNASAAAGITSTDISTWNGKQESLVSGTNIKTINGGSILGSGDISIQSDNIFIAEIGTTSYSDIDTAFQGGKLVIGRVSGTGDTYFPLVVDNSSYYNYYSFQVTSGKFVFEYKIDNTDEWTTSQYVIATDDEATTSKKGLMSSSDKTKLNGIASGAEANVQSDWNQSVNTADDYIKNKPTIPTVSGLLDVFYPVGSYYETSDTSFDPNVAWGGTWTLETSGQVHVSAGGSYSVSGALNNTSDGGASTVKLTAAQSGVPTHSHTYTRPTVVTGGGGHTHTATLKYRNAVPTNGGSAQPWAEGTLHSTNTVTIASNSGTHSHTLTGGGVADNTAAGASSAHNNMQPYIVVNRWHRTA